MRAFPMEIRGFADTFIGLQKVRQQADYALEGEYSKRDVLAMIDMAVGAIDQFEQADVRHRRSFAVHALFKRRLAVSRRTCIADPFQRLAHAPRKNRRKASGSRRFLTGGGRAARVCRARPCAGRVRVGLGADHCLLRR